MFDETRPYNFQFELTDICNAACPMCARTLPLERCQPNPDKVAFTSLHLEDFERNFPQELCDMTNEVSFGGALGEPTLVEDFDLIIDFLTDRGVTVSFSTNGCTNDPGWWQRIGEMMLRTDSWVELHIDGLEDTHSIYRINTDYDQIIENAKAYLGTGARAEWRFIIFRHNQGQIQEAFRRSREMGFERFRLIDTSRFLHGPQFPFVTPDGKQSFLEKATVWGANFRLDDDELIYHDRGEPNHKADAITCATGALNRPHISARGQVAACSWMLESDEEADFFAEHGHDISTYNIKARPLWDIVRDEPFRTEYDEAQAADRFAICRRKCKDCVRSWRYPF